MRYYMVRPQADGIMIDGLKRKLNAYEIFTKNEMFTYQIDEKYMYNTPIDISRSKIYFKYEEHCRFTADEKAMAKVQTNDHRFYS